MRYNRKRTKKCLNDFVVFNGTKCTNEVLVHVLQIKGEPKDLIIKLLNIIYILAHNGSGFDSYIVLNNLTQWRTNLSLMKNGSGIVSPKIFNGYVDQNQESPQYVQFRWSRVHIDISLKKIGASFKLQPCLT